MKALASDAGDSVENSSIISAHFYLLLFHLVVRWAPSRGEMSARCQPSVASGAKERVGWYNIHVCACFPRARSSRENRARENERDLCALAWRDEKRKEILKSIMKSHLLSLLRGLRIAVPPFAFL